MLLLQLHALTQTTPSYALLLVDIDAKQKVDRGESGYHTDLGQYRSCS